MLGCVQSKRFEKQPTGLSMHWQALTPQTYALGESPFWHPVEQMLYWVDIPGQHIHRCNVFMGNVESWAMPSEPGSMAPAESGGLIVALRDGIGIYDVARNMGTSVEMIQQYYGKQATPQMMATKLGGKLKPTHKLKEK